VHAAPGRAFSLLIRAAALKSGGEIAAARSLDGKGELSERDALDGGDAASLYNSAASSVSRSGSPSSDRLLPGSGDTGR